MEEVGVSNAIQVVRVNLTAKVVRIEGGRGPTATLIPEVIKLEAPFAAVPSRCPSISAGSQGHKSSESSPGNENRVDASALELCHQPQKGTECIRRADVVSLINPLLDEDVHASRLARRHMIQHDLDESVRVGVSAK